LFLEIIDVTITVPSLLEAWEPGMAAEDP